MISRYLNLFTFWMGSFPIVGLQIDPLPLDFTTYSVLLMLFFSPSLRQQRPLYRLFSGAFLRNLRSPLYRQRILYYSHFFTRSLLTVKRVAVTKHNLVELLSRYWHSSSAHSPLARLLSARNTGSLWLSDRFIQYPVWWEWTVNPYAS